MNIIFISRSMHDRHGMLVSFSAERMLRKMTKPFQVLCMVRMTIEIIIISMMAKFLMLCLVICSFMSLSVVNLKRAFITYVPTSA